MLKNDEILFTILEDGTVKMETDKIGSANHAQAERLIASIAKQLGGATETIRKREGHSHSHAHAHGHDEAGH